MNHVTLTPEEERAVSKVYNDYQENNQKAHDIARAQIAEEFDIDEEEAETHPEMETKFETVRNNMNNSDIVSIDPNTGEPGKKIPKPKVSSPKFANNMTQARVRPPQEVELDAGEIEQLLTNSGLTVLQSQGVITFVVTKQ